MASSNYAVPIHKDITKYEEKIYGSLTKRQIVGLVLGGTIGLATGWLCVQVAGMPLEYASYIVLILSAPPVLISMWEPDGIKAETYISLAMTQMLARQRLPFKTKADPLVTTFEWNRKKQMDWGAAAEERKG